MGHSVDSEKKLLGAMNSCFDCWNAAACYAHNFFDSEDWNAGKQAAPDTPLATATSDDAKYVLNTHTKKYHLPDCPSVDQMNEKNKSFTDEPREELIARGYTPCGQCNP